MPHAPTEEERADARRADWEREHERTCEDCGQEYVIYEDELEVHNIGVDEPCSLACPAGGQHTFREQDYRPAGPHGFIACDECGAAPEPEDWP